MDEMDKNGQNRQKWTKLTKWKIIDKNGQNWTKGSN